jgi:hypothetical protein
METINKEFCEILSVILNHSYSIKGNILYNCIIPCFKKQLDPRDFNFEDIDEFDYFNFEITCDGVHRPSCYVNNPSVTMSNTRLYLKFLIDTLEDKLSGSVYWIGYDDHNIYVRGNGGAPHSISIKCEDHTLREIGSMRTIDDLRFSMDRSFYWAYDDRYFINTKRNIWEHSSVNYPNYCSTGTINAPLDGVDIIWENKEFYRTSIGWYAGRSRSKLEEGECAICMTTDKSYFVELQCHNTHKFHRKCLALWMIKSRTCPNCRAEVDFNWNERPIQ